MTCGQRHLEVHESLDDFPTPPWATRAVLEIIGAIEGPANLKYMSAREPAANRGFMVRVLDEAFGKVYASDVHDYGMGYQVLDCLFPGELNSANWTITNPPFKLAQRFILRSFETSGWRGTAMLVRTAFLEGKIRFYELFDPHPPIIIAQFCERVPMLQGRLDEQASTATSYCWLIWHRSQGPAPARFEWIAPCRKRLEKERDYDGGIPEDPKPQLPRVPIVKIDVVGNRIFIDSRDIANYVEKEHRHVLTDIDAIKGVCRDSGIPLEEVHSLNEQNGQSYRFFELVEDGMSLLFMNWSTERLLPYKIEYLKAVRAMKPMRRGASSIQGGTHDRRLSTRRIAPGAVFDPHAHASPQRLLRASRDLHPDFPAR
jgi:Rha family phage regulatory protein